MNLIAQTLATKTDLELFVSGISKDGEASGSIGKNQVFTCLFSGHRVFTKWQQSKHHRWRLDSSQLRFYNMSKNFNDDGPWWEEINIEQRHCAFYVFRPGASLVSLICEDLARIDPVQPIIRAVGPNLVIALLMDGPQIEERWPSRYATVLAEDPGSSVLTLTSLGLMRRSGPLKVRRGLGKIIVAMWRWLNREPIPVAEEDPRRIALWKDSSAARARSLRLEKGHHAILLCLDLADEIGFTLDGRCDGCTSVRITLREVLQIAHPTPVPSWVDSG